MKIIDVHEQFRLVCLSLKKFGILISFDTGLGDEVFKAAPYLHGLECIQIVVDGTGVMVFDTRDEMMDIYHQTVGDDGPTSKNPYDGPARVYALTCGDQGQLLTENT